MGFLADYLGCDVYFRTLYEEHNLNVARMQNKLVLNKEKQFDKMNGIIKEFL